MVSINDTIYETSNGYIYSDYNKRKVKIIHSELLYTLPGNPTCTHLLLYIDQPIIDLMSNAIVEKKPLVCVNHYVVISCDSVVIIMYCNSF